MSIEIKERMQSRSFTVGETMTLQLFARGSADSAAIETALTAWLDELELPVTWGYGGPDIDPVWIDTDNPDSCFWNIEVEYRNPALSTPATLETGKTARGFDFSAKNEKLFFDINSTVYTKGNEKPNPDSSAIHWDGKKINGIDIPVPTGTYSIRKKFGNSQITPKYLVSAFKIIGTVNQVKYEGFLPGEMLFKGVSGNQPTDSSDWDLAFHFDVQATRDEFTVDEIKVGEKRGWDAIEYVYGRKIEDSQVKPKLKSVIVHKIFKDSTFKELKL